MWYLLAIPAAIIAGAWAYGMSKVSNKNIPISQLPEKQTYIPPTASSPITASDYIVVDIYTSGLAMPDSGSVLMQVDSLDAPMDQLKQYLMAHIVDNRILPSVRTAVGISRVKRTSVRKATAADITLATGTQSATQYKPAPGPASTGQLVGYSPEFYTALTQAGLLKQAAIKASQLQQSGSGGVQSATQYNPAPGSMPMSIVDVQLAAEKARMEAINKLVPESTTPEATAALLALANLPSVAEQS